MSILSNEIAAYGNLFDDFRQLRNLRSPESSPKRRKSARNKNKSSNEPTIPHNSLPEVPITSSVLSCEYVESDKSSNKNGIVNNINESSVNAVPSPTFSETVRNDNTAVDNLNHLNVPSAVPVPSTSGIAKKAGELISPRSLVVIPPNKYVFVSRLAYDTTIEDVEFYLKSNLGTSVNIFITKFAYAHPRSIASFKIAVPANFYDQIVDPRFWPENILVREYVFKDNSEFKNRNSVRLPAGNSAVPKN